MVKMWPSTSCRTFKWLCYRLRGEYMSKISETVWPDIWGILKLSVLNPDQPENLQTVHQILNSIRNISQDLSSNVEEFHQHTLRFNIKETQVCVWVDLLPRHHNFQVLLHVTSLVKGEPVWCKTVYHKWKFLKPSIVCLGSETVSSEKDRQLTFYSPLVTVEIDYRLTSYLMGTPITDILIVQLFWQLGP